MCFKYGNVSVHLDSIMEGVMLLKIHRKGNPEGEFEFVKVTETEYHILVVLGQRKVYAYGIYKRSNGTISLNGLYTMLNRMKEKCLVATEKEGQICEFCGSGSKVLYQVVFDFMERC